MEVYLANTLAHSQQSDINCFVFCSLSIALCSALCFACQCPGRFLFSTASWSVHWAKQICQLGQLNSIQAHSARAMPIWLWNKPQNRRCALSLCVLVHNCHMHGHVLICGLWLQQHTVQTGGHNQTRQQAAGSCTTLANDSRLGPATGEQQKCVKMILLLK